jgi:hypothetical protein
MLDSMRLTLCSFLRVWVRSLAYVRVGMYLDDKKGVKRLIVLFGVYCFGL